MALSEVCTKENEIWETDLMAAFHYTNSDGIVRTVVRYRIPLTAQQEAVFLAKHDMQPDDRLPFYKNMVNCIQQQVSVSRYLQNVGVTSVLNFYSMEQERDEKGVSFIYLETEQVWPILFKLLSGSVDVITLLDVIYRIGAVLKSLGKSGVNVIHRGLDLPDVYINAEDRIRLGGFYYACYPEKYGFPAYMPDHPANLPESLLRGETGSEVTDVQTLAMVAWNLLSGLPHDAVIDTSRLVFPQYATPELALILKEGMEGTFESCNQFRRKLLNCRNQLKDTEYAKTLIPIRSQLVKTFSVAYEEQQSKQ